MEKLKLKNRRGDLVEGVFKKLDISYIDKIMELQKGIVDNLSNKNFYAPTDKNEFI